MQNKGNILVTPLQGPCNCYQYIYFSIQLLPSLFTDYSNKHLLSDYQRPHTVLGVLCVITHFVLEITLSGIMITPILWKGKLRPRELRHLTPNQRTRILQTELSAHTPVMTSKPPQFLCPASTDTHTCGMRAHSTFHTLLFHLRLQDQNNCSQVRIPVKPMGRASLICPLFGQPI